MSICSSEQPAEGVEADAASTAEKPPKAPASLYSKNEAPVQLVLCIDTMGQVRECQRTTTMILIRSTGLGRTSSSVNVTPVRHLLPVVMCRVVLYI